MRAATGKLSRKHKMKRLGEVNASDEVEEYIYEKTNLIAPDKLDVAPFFNWQVGSLRSIWCVPYECNPELKQLLKKYLKKSPTPKEGCCFDTAFNLTMFSEKIGYVEGYSVIQIHDFVYDPILHAWNFFETKNGTIYFDATCEFGPNPDLIGQANYLKVMQLNQNELSEYNYVAGLNQRVQGPFIYEDFVVKSGRRKPFPPDFSWDAMQNNLVENSVRNSPSKVSGSGWIH